MVATSFCSDGSAFKSVAASPPIKIPKSNKERDEGLLSPLLSMRSRRDTASGPDLDAYVGSISRLSDLCSTDSLSTSVGVERVPSPVSFMARRPSSVDYLAEEEKEKKHKKRYILDAREIITTSDLVKNRCKVFGLTEGAENREVLRILNRDKYDLNLLDDASWIKLLKAYRPLKDCMVLGLEYKYFEFRTSDRK